MKTPYRMTAECDIGISREKSLGNHPFRLRLLTKTKVTRKLHLGELFTLQDRYGGGNIASAMLTCMLQDGF